MNGATARATATEDRNEPQPASAPGAFEVVVVIRTHRTDDAPPHER